MDLYRKGISGKLAEYAVKKYRSHRRIPDGVIIKQNNNKLLLKKLTNKNSLIVI